MGGIGAYRPHLGVDVVKGERSRRALTAWSAARRCSGAVVQIEDAHRTIRSTGAATWHDWAARAPFSAFLLQREERHDRRDGADASPRRALQRQAHRDPRVSVDQAVIAIENVRPVQRSGQEPAAGERETRCRR